MAFQLNAFQAGFAQLTDFVQTAVGRPKKLTQRKIYIYEKDEEKLQEPVIDRALQNKVNECILTLAI